PPLASFSDGGIGCLEVLNSPTTSSPSASGVAPIRGSRVLIRNWSLGSSVESIKFAAYLNTNGSRSRPHLIYFVSKSRRSPLNSPRTLFHSAGPPTISRAICVAVSTPSRDFSQSSRLSVLITLYGFNERTLHSFDGVCDSCAHLVVDAATVRVCF